MKAAEHWHLLRHGSFGSFIYWQHPVKALDAGIVILNNPRSRSGPNVSDVSAVLCHGGQLGNCLGR